MKSNPLKYSISVNSKLLEAPRVSHQETVACISRYLKRAPGLGILYRLNRYLKVEGFIDAYWIGSPSNKRSTAGYYTFLGDNLVTWKSTKQKVVARSSAEAQHMPMAHTTSKLTLLQHFLQKIGFSALIPIPLFFL